MNSPEKLSQLRRVITENLRVQKYNEFIEYVDVSNALADVTARQNHAIFGRRGCGKTLLLHYSSANLDRDKRAIYLNCEDFKHHSFPNVLIEILIALLMELKKNATGWFGRKRRVQELLEETKNALEALHLKPDNLEADIKTSENREVSRAAGGEGGASSNVVSFKLLASLSSKSSSSTERAFKLKHQKLDKLNLFLPRLKEKLKEFFENSSKVKYIFLQIDDLYHLHRLDQAFVMDYIHRLCKDLHLYFKVATLRHNSTLYVDIGGQPVGTQERHDYQPIDVDYTFHNFARTEQQNRRILYEFGRQSEMTPDEIDSLFKGEGFSRLVMAGGGVPRDVLSLFLQVLNSVSDEPDPRIGKDHVRLLSKEVFERRIEDLKQDCKEEEQDALLRGIYTVREFCTDKTTNIFLIRERDLQKEDAFRALIYRLLDYRIVHSCANALTHKSRQGTFQAFAVDIGAYANLRKLQGKFEEIDVSGAHAKEQMRSAPVMEISSFEQYIDSSPSDIESALVREE